MADIGQVCRCPVYAAICHRAVQGVVTLPSFFFFFSNQDIRLGEGNRRNEFAEWHVAWLAE